MSQTLNAFDFAQTRSKKDADLLWEAKVCASVSCAIAWVLRQCVVLHHLCDAFYGVAFWGHPYLPSLDVALMQYGKRGEDGKMTPEQYAALRRKVGGTAKDYW